MKDISKWLSHSNITTTERIYAHYDEKTLASITGILDGEAAAKDKDKDK